METANELSRKFQISHKRQRVLVDVIDTFQGGSVVSIVTNAHEQL